MDKPLLILHDRNLSSLAKMVRNLTPIFKDLVGLKVGIENVTNEVFPDEEPWIYTYRKGRLDEAIHMLRIWQQMTDPTWVLMVEPYGDSMAMTPSTSQNFKPYSSKAGPYKWKSGPPGQLHPYTLPAIPLQDLDTMRVSNIPFSPFGITRKEKATKHIVHTIEPLNPDRYKKLGKSVRDPQSLRDQLINNAEPAPVSERLSIGHEIAKALGYAHALGITHINVHPENILRLQTRDKKGSSAFLAALVGCPKDDRLSPDGEIALERSIYQHPPMQNTIAVEDPILQHNIYSLGVCLLEIGLWQSFISYDAHTMRTTLSRITGIADDASQGEMEEFLTKSAKQRFIDLACNELCYSMGTEYSEVVEMCLTCLDPYRSCGFLCEFETDEYGIQVGVEYIEKILQQLDTLHVNIEISD